MDEIKRTSMAVLVDNQAGVLSQVTRLFSRKGYNIESLAVGTTDDPAISRITIEVLADEDHALLLSNQLRKLFPVHSVKLLSPQRSIRRELILLKVRAETGEKRTEVIQIANIFRASIIDVSTGSLTIALIGDENKTAAIQAILEQFELLELARTGIVAMERGLETITAETKERDEFNLGKNYR
ncbi:MAG: acetolactate synthase small subunit [Oscillospiraceae bacterium]|nr:acetolactate synthase small subunit [Oscillospiraceae bacterium]MBQ2633822.1 acetolactate synthase small subunit [Oscillospiraceae bacterium]MBR3084267.1 acetolactate synthase small subunit [Oscillospiraceae bacterium]MBR3860499.1 acetolactate synthase small subunit [Oscillospiraceae bacterium]MBR6095971.1 acetolactate synthase small subunit [Oscillospiraceae bacterium]